METIHIQAGETEIHNLTESICSMRDNNGMSALIGMLRSTGHMGKADSEGEWREGDMAGEGVVWKPVSNVTPDQPRPLPGV